MRRHRERRTRGRSTEDRLQAQSVKLKEYERIIGQLRKYVRQLENQIGVSEDPSEEPIKSDESPKPVEICPKCKSTNVGVVSTKKVDKPIKIIKCKDCEEITVI